MWRSLLVDDVDRQQADLLAFLVCDENGIPVVLHFRLVVEHAPCDGVGAVHGFDVVGQLGVAGVEMGSHIHKIKMIRRHLSPPYRPGGRSTAGASWNNSRRSGGGERRKYKAYASERRTFHLPSQRICKLPVR